MLTFSSTRQNIEEGEQNQYPSQYCPGVLGGVEDSFFLSSTGEEERRRGDFVFLFRSKESSSRTNIHAATEDLSFTFTLKRVRHKELEKMEEGILLFKS